jgi:hypothetical protein
MIQFAFAGFASTLRSLRFDPFYRKERKNRKGPQRVPIQFGKLHQYLSKSLPLTTDPE